MSYYSPRQNTKSYGLIKRFRHEEEYANRPHKKYWTKFVIDKQERTILGHRPSRWGSICIFYLFFYTGVAMLFASCWVGFHYLALNATTPSELTKQPGVLFAPYLANNFITYDINNDDVINEYSTSITDFLSKYGDGTERFGGDKGCSPLDDYGFATKTPCIFLKINRIYGFKTVPYLKAKELPIHAPEELRSFVDSSKDAARKGRIWISCISNLSDDSEPAFTYYPSLRSVPVSAVDMEGTLIPFKKILYFTRNEMFYDLGDYVRVVAVKLSELVINEVIKIKCYFWAKNIVQSEDTKLGIGRGVLKFYILITNDLIDNV